MRTNLLRSFAVTLGLSVCTIAHAQYPSQYTAPSKWNNFNAPQPANLYLAAADEEVAKKGAKAVKKAAKNAAEPAELPAPMPMPESITELPQPVAEPYTAAPYSTAPIASDCGPCQSSSPYSAAAAAPWGGESVRPELSPYFGGANLLFLTMENGGHRNLINEDATGNVILGTGAVDPSASTGFDIYAGRYLNCNQYGLSIGYMLWNPSQEQVLSIPGTPGDYRAAFPAWNDVSVDPGTGNDTIYNHYDNAEGYRVRRDMLFQGLEVNLSSFGIMGAQRAAAMGSGSVFGNKFSRGLGLGNSCKGHGGATGPLVRSNSGRVQVITSHGLRWFQVEDEFEFAANINATAGYQADDLYYNVDTENNLYGYQFGSRLVYCLSNRWNLSIGGKFGLYGNRAEYRQRLGTLTTLATRNGPPGDAINTEDSDTVLSTLGELDLGLGYRMSNAWSIRGGYRLMGLTGIATATDQFATEYGSGIGPSTYVKADDSILLHGGYVGLEYNW